MKTKILSTTDPNAIPAALKILRAGELVAFPTDTVYGMGTFALNAEGAKKIYLAKQRPPEKAIPILLGDMQQLEEVAINIPQRAYKLAAAFLPGALTLVLPKHPKIPEAVSALGSVGVRIPDHEFARALLNAAGPMAVSSANLSGAGSAVSAEEVYRQLNGSLPLILDGGETPGGTASTVIDCTSEEIVLLREGPISLNEIQALLEH